MILVADSGSTKTDWVLANNGVLVAEYNTSGFNPFFHTEKNVLDALQAEKEMAAIREKVTSVKFFGAGCSSPARNAIIEGALKKFFTSASITVEHDLKGSVLATCGNEKGIACILGTGSNVCYYDGKNIAEGSHGLGYVLGDEGSGSYYGKKLLAYYLYEILPDDLHKKFKSDYNLTKEIILDNVYHQPDANVYLASFARFLSENREHRYIQKLVTKGMEEFFETNVCAIEQHQEVPVHFVGSIAYYFAEILKDVAKLHHVTTGKIIRKPIHDLLRFFAG
jgi:glucosamine kinase